MNNYDTFEPHTIHPTKQLTNDAVKSAYLISTPRAAYQNDTRLTISCTAPLAIKATSQKFMEQHTLTLQITHLEKP